METMICCGTWQGENLLAAVREAAYEAGLGTPSCEVLFELATRLSATPLAVKNWGMEK